MEYNFRPLKHGGGLPKVSYSSPRHDNRRYEDRHDQHTERKMERINQDVAIESNATKTMAYKDESSLEGDDTSSVNSGARSPPTAGRVGFQKKIKLADDCNSQLTESFESFYEMHKRMRQFTENRPSSESAKITKPHILPTAERGLRGPQRPMTAGKLSEIAATKYPHSIFKVFIPQDTTLKQKRVIPLEGKSQSELRPRTPPKSPKLIAIRGSPEPFHHSELVNLESGLRTKMEPPTLKTKHSAPIQNGHGENYSVKAAGESPDTVVHIPKRITLLTDISLTKEQERKRLKERARMRKRTMDSVKKAFPPPRVEEHSEQTENHSVLPLQEVQEEAEMSGDDPATAYPSSLPVSLSKVSLKSVPSHTSSAGPVLTPKRSVTWSNEVITVSQEEEKKPEPVRKRRTAQRNKSEHATESGNAISKVRRRTRSDSDASSYGKCFKGTEKKSNRKENVCSFRDESAYQVRTSRVLKSPEATPRYLYKRRDIPRCTRTHEIIERKISKKYRRLNDYSTDSERDKYRPVSRSSQRNPYSRENMTKTKSGRGRKFLHCKWCNCCQAPVKTKFESFNKAKSRDSDRYNSDDREGADTMCKRKAQYNNDVTFQNQRNAIIRKHHNHGNSDFSDNNESDSDGASGIRQDLRSWEDESEKVRRGRSTPSFGLKSNTVEENSFGSSDSELQTSIKKRSGYETKVKAPCSKLHPRNVNELDFEDNHPVRKNFGTSQYNSEIREHEIPSSKQEVSFQKENRKVPRNSNSLSTPQVPEKVKYRVNVKHCSDTVVLEHSRNVVAEDDQPDVEKNTHDSRDVVPPMIKAYQNANKKATGFVSMSIQDDLDRPYLLVESFNFQADLGHRDTKSAKSVLLEASNSANLIREPPMLNITFTESSGKSINDANQDINNSCLTSEINLQGSSNINNLSQKSLQHQSNRSLQFQSSKSLQSLEYQSLTSIECKTCEKNEEQQTDNKVNNQLNDVTTAQTMLAVESTSSPRANKSNNSISSFEKKKSVQNQPSQNRLNINQRSTENKLPRIFEERKNQLKEMLSKRTVGGGPSAVTNQILEKWNMTQKSINARKEKMLASRRDTPLLEPKDVPVSDKTEQNKNEIPLLNISNNSNFGPDDPISVASARINPGNNSEQGAPTNDDMSVEQSMGRCISEYPIGEEDFTKLIALPGSREPQPYSTMQVMSEICHERNFRDNTLPYPYSTPEKPLCESNSSRLVRIKLVQRSSNMPDILEPSSTIIQVDNLDDNLSQRESTNPIRTTPSSLFLHESNENMNFSPTSVTDVSSGLYNLRNLGARFGTIIFTPLRSLSVEALHSDNSNATVIPMSSNKASSVARNVPASSRSTPTKKSSKAATFSRSAMKARPLSRSRDRSTPGWSKACSPGARRGVRLLERPPSRKPPLHMIDSSDDDSDHDFLSGSQTSPLSINADQMRSTSLSFTETQKKPPASRMYSTLKDTPTSAQEYIKSAMRDLQVEDVISPHTDDKDAPLREQQDSIRGQKDEKMSLRPASRASNPKAHVPRMSPGSVKILQEKSKSPGGRQKFRKESDTDDRDSSPNAWVRSTMRQEFHNEQVTPGEKRASTNTSINTSPVRNKPPFRYYCNINKNGEPLFPTKYRKVPSPNLPNYLPPWERVNLTPPESALQERAINEKRLGIVSRVTTAAMEAIKLRDESPKSEERRTSRSLTPNSLRSSDSQGNETPDGGRSPIGPRTPPRRQVERRIPNRCTPPTVAAPRSSPRKSCSPQRHHVPVGTSGKPIQKVPKHTKPILKSSRCRGRDVDEEKWGFTGSERSPHIPEMPSCIIREGLPSPEMDLIYTVDELHSVTALERRQNCTYSEEDMLTYYASDGSSTFVCCVCDKEQQQKKKRKSIQFKPRSNSMSRLPSRINFCEDE